MTALPRLTTTGRPELADLESNVRRALDQLHGQSVDGSYAAADPSNWSGTPPATVQEALNRIAAALGPIP